MKISKITGREILDSRGLPTIECELMLENGLTVRAAAPSGTSRGSYEAFELRDKDESRLFGFGVSKAIEKLENVIAPELIGNEPEVVEMDMHLIELDGTENKSNLGGNTMIAVSMAIAKAQAASAEIELYELIAHLCDQGSVSIPFPLLNFINGGVHADTGFGVQEIMIVPVGAQTFRESLESSVVIYYALKELLKESGQSVNVGLEGGFAPHFSDVRQALDILMKAIELSGVQGQVFLALDIAANQLYDHDAAKYRWQSKLLSTSEMVNVYKKLVSEYPIYSIEDPFYQDDWNGWRELTAEISAKVQVVGDDIFATNPYRITKGIEEKAATAAIIKPNQIGTVTETLQTINVCKEHDMQVMISHRSGETDEIFITDLAVGTSAGHLKAGSCTRGERVDKYNRLLRIEDALMMQLLD